MNRFGVYHREPWVEVLRRRTPAHEYRCSDRPRVTPAFVRIRIVLFPVEITWFGPTATMDRKGMEKSCIVPSKLEERSDRVN